MSKSTGMQELKKAQDVIMETIDKSAKTNLETFEKLMELNRTRLSASAEEVKSPGDFIARQSAVFKEYAEQLGAHVEALTNIGNESREQLTAISQEFAKGLDFSALFPMADTGTRSKTKSGAKSN